MRKIYSIQITVRLWKGRHMLFESLLHLVTCPPEGLLIRSVCEINVYILDGLGMCSTSI